MRAIRQLRHVVAEAVRLYRGMARPHRHRYDWSGDLLYDGPWCSDEKCLDCGERRWWPT